MKSGLFGPTRRRSPVTVITSNEQMRSAAKAKAKAAARGGSGSGQCGQPERLGGVEHLPPARTDPDGGDPPVRVDPHRRQQPGDHQDRVLGRDDRAPPGDLRDDPPAGPAGEGDRAGDIGAVGGDHHQFGG